MTIPTELPASPAAEGISSLEVRWIFPGQLEAAVAGWFGRFPVVMESREDIYLLSPRLRGLSVKVRGGAALEVKAFRGSPGILDVVGRARGRLESWQKWSFPFGPGEDSADPTGWMPVRKRRRICRFSLASGAPEDSAGSRGAGSNSPRSAPVARTGGPWDSRRPAPPPSCAASSRPPPRWCLPRRCPAVRNPDRSNPGPMRNGCASGREPSATRMTPPGTATGTRRGDA